MAPTDLSRNPTVERSSSHHTITAAAMASGSPAWTRTSPTVISGRRADSAPLGDQVVPAFRLERLGAQRVVQQAVEM